MWTGLGTLTKRTVSALAYVSGQMQYSSAATPRKTQGVKASAVKRSLRSDIAVLE